MRNFRDGDVQPHDPTCWITCAPVLPCPVLAPVPGWPCASRRRCVPLTMNWRPPAGNGARMRSLMVMASRWTYPGALPANGVARGRANGVPRVMAPVSLQPTTTLTASGVKNRPHSGSWPICSSWASGRKQTLRHAQGQGLTRGQASDLIGQARQTQRSQSETSVNSAANGQSPQRSHACAQRQRADQLASRFASLEQALTNLTEALAGRGNGRVGKRTG